MYKYYINQCCNIKIYIFAYFLLWNSIIQNVPLVSFKNNMNVLFMVVLVGSKQIHFNKLKLLEMSLEYLLL